MRRKCKLQQQLSLLQKQFGQSDHHLIPVHHRNHHSRNPVKTWERSLLLLQNLHQKYQTDLLDQSNEELEGYLSSCSTWPNAQFASICHFKGLKWGQNNVIQVNSASTLYTEIIPHKTDSSLVQYLAKNMSTWMPKCVTTLITIKSEYFKLTITFQGPWHIPKYSIHLRNQSIWR